MSKHFNKLFILFLFIIVPLNAQDIIQPNPFWINGSAGMVSPYLNLGISYNKKIGQYSYQFAINGSTKHILSGIRMGTINAGFGFADSKEWLISSVHLGPSLSYGKARDKSDIHRYFWGAGVTLNVQAYFMPLHKVFPGLGLGVEFFYNFNALQTETVDYKNVYSIKFGICLTNNHDNPVR